MTDAHLVQIGRFPSRRSVSTVPRPQGPRPHLPEASVKTLSQDECRQTWSHPLRALRKGSIGPHRACVRCLVVQWSAPMHNRKSHFEQLQGGSVLSEIFSDSLVPLAFQKVRVEVDMDDCGPSSCDLQSRNRPGSSLFTSSKSSSVGRARSTSIMSTRA
ncbi:hypothetical protein BC628DRAFT_1366398 [Trametes gibbosa]|nr:hypothetical protein BC628DRAFT_1366398 [Trametes gibbosa]